MEAFNMPTFTNHRGQVSIEFMAIFGFVFFVFIVISIIFLEKSTEVNKQKELLLLDDLAKSLQKEILLAAEVEDGYTRSFIIPSSIDQYNYTLITSSQEITVRTESYDIHKKIPTINGNLTKGNNTITKTQGTITISHS